MALDSFDNLKAAIISYDGSNNLSQHIDDAVSVTEQRMFSNQNEILKIRPTNTRSTAEMDITSRFLALPQYYISMERLKYIEDSDDRDIKFRVASGLHEREQAGKPEYFTVTSQIEFERLPDTAYTIEMQFMAEIVPLSDNATTNTVLTNNPDIYIHGCLWYLNSLPNAEQQIGSYHEQEFYKAIRGANQKYNAGNYGPTPVRRTNRCVP